MISSSLFTGTYSFGQWWRGVKKCLPVRQAWSFSSSMSYCFFFLFMPTVTRDLGYSHELLYICFQHWAKLKNFVHLKVIPSPRQKTPVFSIVCPCLLMSSHAGNLIWTWQGWFLLHKIFCLYHTMGSTRSFWPTGPCLVQVVSFPEASSPPINVLLRNFGLIASQILYHLLLNDPFFKNWVVSLAIGNYLQLLGGNQGQPQNPV